MCSVTLRDINWTLFASRFWGIFLPWGKAAGARIWPPPPSSVDARNTSNPFSWRGA